MAAPAPKAGGIEAQPVGHGQVFEPLSGLDPGPFAGLEGPLLLVGNEFQDDEAEGQGRRNGIHPAERHVHVHHHEGGQAGHQDDGVLVDADEKQVEQGPFPAGLELFPSPQNGPAVILFPFPETQAVGPFPGEVEGQAGAPEGRERGHHDKAQRQTAFHRDHPGIGDGKETPEFVHLAVVPGQFPDDKAVEGARAADDTEGPEHPELLCVQGRPDKNVQKRAGNQGESEHRSDRSDFHSHTYLAQRYEKMFIFA